MMTDTEKQHKGHIAVGLVGVPILTEWAIRNREVDFLYQMLKKRDYPGYLYMIDNGATATWEYWSGERVGCITAIMESEPGFIKQ